MYLRQNMPGINGQLGAPVYSNTATQNNVPHMRPVGSTLHQGGNPLHFPKHMLHQQQQHQHQQQQQQQQHSYQHQHQRHIAATLPTEPMQNVQRTSNAEHARPGPFPVPVIHPSLRHPAQIRNTNTFFAPPSMNQGAVVGNRFAHHMNSANSAMSNGTQYPVNKANSALLKGKKKVNQTKQSKQNSAGLSSLSSQGIKTEPPAGLKADVTVAMNGSSQGPLAVLQKFAIQKMLSTNSSKTEQSGPHGEMHLLAVAASQEGKSTEEKKKLSSAMEEAAALLNKHDLVTGTTKKKRVAITKEAWKRKRCQHDGCTKIERGGNFCLVHGGGERCVHHGCNAVARLFKRCYKHCPAELQERCKAYVSYKDKALGRPPPLHMAWLPDARTVGGERTQREATGDEALKSNKACSSDEGEQGTPKQESPHPEKRSLAGRPQIPTSKAAIHRAETKPCSKVQSVPLQHPAGGKGKVQSKSDDKCPKATSQGSGKVLANSDHSVSTLAAKDSSQIATAVRKHPTSDNESVTASALLCDNSSAHAALNLAKTDSLPGAVLTPSPKANGDTIQKKDAVDMEVDTVEAIPVASVTKVHPGPGNVSTGKEIAVSPPNHADKHTVQLSEDSVKGVAAVERSISEQDSQEGKDVTKKDVLGEIKRTLPGPETLSSKPGDSTQANPATSDPVEAMNEPKALKGGPNASRGQVVSCTSGSKSEGTNDETGGRIGVMSNVSFTTLIQTKGKCVGATQLFHLLQAQEKLTRKTKRDPDVAIGKRDVSELHIFYKKLLGRGIQAAMEKIAGPAFDDITMEEQLFYLPDGWTKVAGASGKAKPKLVSPDGLRKFNSVQDAILDVIPEPAYEHAMSVDDYFWLFRDFVPVAKQKEWVEAIKDFKVDSSFTLRMTDYKTIRKAIGLNGCRIKVTTYEYIYACLPMIVSYSHDREVAVFRFNSRRSKFSFLPKALMSLLPSNTSIPTAERLAKAKQSRPGQAQADSSPKSNNKPADSAKSDKSTAKAKGKAAKEGEAAGEGTPPVKRKRTYTRRAK